MPKPCANFFAENHVAEPFSTNTEEDVASCFALLPSTHEQRSTYTFLHKTFLRCKGFIIFFRRAIEFVI